MFDKLKKLFVVSDDQFKDKVAGDSNNKIPTNDSSTVIDPKTDASLPAAQPISGKGDPKFINILLGAIEKQNMEGFDYLEFKQSLQNLNDLSMDESTKYNSAMAMAKTMGVSVKTIEDSAKHYLQILKAEEEKFKQALVGQKNKIDEDRTNGIENIKKSVALKEQQIQKLQEEIEASKKHLKNKETEIKEATQKIQSTNDQFSHAYSIIVQQIIDDVKNLNTYV